MTIHLRQVGYDRAPVTILENHIAIRSREIVNVDLKEMARERGKRE